MFDENLSFRLVEQLADVYPHSLHVRDVGLTGRPDEEIWRYAVRQNCAIVTKDIDFYQRSMLRGAPPKVIWVRIGNATTRAIADCALGSRRCSTLSPSRTRRFLSSHPTINRPLDLNLSSGLRLR
ncbi:DUF5615 family PIN-like protein [Sulfobacillus harzensis]|uniref:DUF5615 family PIN-like protein n=1 Tax=Sulfobacillus harzensis TaxID=2729629 RepID=UPI001A9B1A1E|nr:DUF5615 family PIN-like protein [Sulfobacillus harzensis]